MTDRLKIALAQLIERPIGILACNSSLGQRSSRPLTPQTPSLGVPRHGCRNLDIVQITELSDPLDGRGRDLGLMFAIQQPLEQFRLSSRASRQSPAGRVIGPLFGFLAIARWPLRFASFSPHGPRV